jgi:integrase
MHETRLSLVAPSRDLETLIEKTKAYIRGAKAPATLLAYKSDFRDFTRFCREHNLSFLPSTPETVALYITDCASRLASATITRRLTSITKAHQSAGLKDSPASTHHFIVSETLKGIRRAIGTAQHGKKPLLTADIRRIIARCPKGLRGWRDRALLLIGFAGAFRRSELAAIEVSDVVVFEGRPGHRPAPLEDRSASAWPTGRHSLRAGCRDMSGPRGAPLAEGIAHQVRAPVPRDQPSRPRQSARFESRLGRLDSEASGAEGGHEDQAAWAVIHSAPAA